MKIKKFSSAIKNLSLGFLSGVACDSNSISYLQIKRTRAGKGVGQ